MNLSHMLKQAGASVGHATASPIYGGIGVSPLGPFGVFLGLMLGAYGTVNAFKNITICTNCCNGCKKSKSSCECTEENDA